MALVRKVSSGLVKKAVKSVRPMVKNMGLCSKVSSFAESVALFVSIQWSVLVFCQAGRQR